jgi:hypothetical protein
MEEKEVKNSGALLLRLVYVSRVMGTGTYVLTLLVSTWTYVATLLIVAIATTGIV